MPRSTYEPRDRSDDDLLFPAASVAMDSPRLAWIKRTGIVTYHSLPNDPDASCWYAALWCFSEDYPELDGCKPSDSQDVGLLFMMETGRNGEQRIGVGDSQDDAISDFCKKAGIKLWNEEGA